MERVAAKYGVDPDELRSVAPYYGVKQVPSSIGEAAGYGLKGVIGGIGRGTFLGAPQSAYTEQQDPRMQGALEELNRIREKQQGAIESTGEMMLFPAGAAGELPAAASMAAKIGRGVGRAATAAGFGAVSSAANAPVEERGSAAVRGAEFGLGLGVAAEATGALVGRLAQRGTLSPIEAQEAHAVIHSEGPALDAGTDAILHTREASEQHLADAVLRGTELTPEAEATVAREQLGPEKLEASVTPGTEEGQLHQREAGPDATPADVVSNLSDSLVETRARDFAEDLTGERPADLAEARQAISDYADRQGMQYTEERYTNYVRGEAGLEYLRESGVSNAGLAPNFGNRAAQGVSDAQFAFRNIDRELGTNTEGILSDTVRNTNRMTFSSKRMQQQLDGLEKQYRDVSPLMRDGTIPAAIESGDLSTLPERAQRLAQRVQSLLEDWRDFANGGVLEHDPTLAPLSIPERENYIPHTLKNGPDLYSAYRDQLGEALEQARDLTGRNIADLSELKPAEVRKLSSTEGPTQELLRGVELLGGDATPRTGANLANSLRDSFEMPRGREAQGTKARAALEREDAIPDWMRETNGWQLLDRWRQNTLRHLYLRQPFDRMRRAAMLADKAGDTLGSQYIRNWIADQTGVRSGTLSSFSSDVQRKWGRAMDQLQATGRPELKAAATLGKAIPDVFRDLSRQIYPNFIGLNPKSHIQHLLQPLTKMIPELGNTPYGAELTLRGAVNANLNFRSQLQRAEKMGLLPNEFLDQYRRTTATGLRDNPIYGGLARGAELSGRAAMYTYGKVFQLNKAIALSISDQLAADLSRNVPQAEAVLQRFPKSVQRSVNAARAAGDAVETNRLLAQHISDTTTYNFNQASKAEFARAAGPSLSMFTKWPAATAGDIISGFRDRGAVAGSLQAISKYMLPLAALRGIDFLIFGRDPDSLTKADYGNMTDLQRKILGSRGLAGTAPIESVAEFGGREFWTPPLVDNLYHSVILPSMERDPEKAAHGLANTVGTFVPGGIWVRFLTDDLPTYLTTHRPPGDDYLERARSGAKVLQRRLAP